MMNKNKCFFFLIQQLQMGKAQAKCASVPLIFKRCNDVH